MTRQTFIDKSASPADISLAELIVSSLIAAGAAIILISYLLDVAGWPIIPQSVGPLLIIGTALVLWVVTKRRYLNIRVRWGEVAGLAVILVLLPLYIYWLSSNNWFPASGSVDVVHHLRLISFIQERASLPHDRDLWRYLVEFTFYSPGSHILAALAGRLLGVTGFYTVEPIMALAATLRASVFYLIALRLLPEHRARPLLALAGTVLVFAAYAYVVNSFMLMFYYAQVVSELFALAMLWALVVWHEQPWFGPLAFFSLCGVAVWLTWPVWLAAPVLALLGLLLLRTDLAWTRRAMTLALTLLPIAAIVIGYTVQRTSELTILKAEGGVAHPTVGVFGWPMLIAAIVGIATSWRRKEVYPVWLFAAVLLAQIAAFVVLNSMYHVQTYYQTYKTFYLLVYPLGLYATLGLASLWEIATHRWPRVGIPLAAALPFLALALALSNGLPSQPVQRDGWDGAFTEPLYSTAMWAQKNLPSGCVDYLVGNATTAYWLHLEIGNPRADARTEELGPRLAARQNSANQWARPRGYPYAIVEDMQRVPEDVRSHFKVLYENGPSAVVYRTGECDDDTVSLQNYRLPPRTNTLAARIDQVLGTHFAVY